MSPVLAEKPWGGRRLAEYGKVLPDGVWIGESWDVADLPADAVSAVADPRSRVASGQFEGRALCELIAEFGEDLLGCASPTPEGDFPLLVKLLDAREHLSVQVHPDRKYVKKHPTARLKTESWYVVAADPGAHLYLGLRDGATVADVASRMGTAGIVGLLRTIPAMPGDFHHLPAGLVHALGAGVMVAEVQTPSDTTFRLYDWEDRYGRPNRPMHGAEALEAIRPDLDSVMSSRPEGPGSRRLLARELYWMTEHRSSGGSVEIVRRPEVRVIVMVAGAARIDRLEVAAGATVVVPACVVLDAAIEATADTVILEVGLV
ncbi:MAG: hypothetical protein GY720_06235 [bacterium]|nr:hypothetical protein [bacterium]